VRTKATGLINTIRWIETTYGKASLADVVARCSPPVRARVASAIAIEWVPITEVVEFIENADKVLGTGTGKLAEVAGEAGAHASLKGPMLKLVFYLARPEYLMRRTASFWRQYQDAGEMHLRSFAEGEAVFELTGADETYSIYCGLLTGWFREIARATGIANPAVRHLECIAKDDERCVWDIRWAGKTG
jgi:hypothetical protein